MISERQSEQPKSDVPAIRFQHGGISELFLTTPASPATSSGEVLELLRSPADQSAGWQVVRQTAFAADRNAPESANGAAWPLTLLSAITAGGQSPGGTHIQALQGAGVQTFSAGGRVAAVVYEDDYARYSFLGGLVPTDIRASRRQQTLQVFEQMANLLEAAGMTFSDVARTWFYLDGILDWYADFNRARDEFFAGHGRVESVLPASTGIGGRNRRGAALITEALAVRSKSEKVLIRNVRSPLQCPASEYGSSFSRAIEIAAPDYSRLLVSGTASIGPDGKSMHPRDAYAQVKVTMQVVEAILKSRGMDWEDTCRAFAYFKHAGDMGALERFCTVSGIAPLPVIVSENDICRPELLFEIELDAIKSGSART